MSAACCSVLIAAADSVVTATAVHAGAFLISFHLFSFVALLSLCLCLLYTALEKNLSAAPPKPIGARLLHMYDLILARVRVSLLRPSLDEAQATAFVARGALRVHRPLQCLFCEFINWFLVSLLTRCLSVAIGLLCARAYRGAGGAAARQYRRAVCTAGPVSHTRGALRCDTVSPFSLARDAFLRSFWSVR